MFETDITYSHGKVGQKYFVQPIFQAYILEIRNWVSLFKLWHNRSVDQTKLGTLSTDDEGDDDDE